MQCDEIAVNAICLEYSRNRCILFSLQDIDSIVFITKYFNLQQVST